MSNLTTIEVLLSFSWGFDIQITKHKDTNTLETVAQKFYLDFSMRVGLGLRLSLSTIVICSFIPVIFVAYMHLLISKLLALNLKTAAAAEDFFSFKVPTTVQAPALLNDNISWLER